MRKRVLVWRIICLTLLIGSPELDRSLSAQQDQPETNSPNTETLEKLQAAAAEQPENLSTQLSYAQALFKAGNLEKAVQHLGLAYQISPQDAGVLQGIEATLNAFKLTGLLNVSVPQATVIEKLGKPHREQSMPWGQRHVYGLIAIDYREGVVHEIVNLSKATAALFQPTEIVDVGLDGRSWKCGLREKGNGASTAYFFLPGESVAKWTEMFVVERILDGTSVGSIDDVVVQAVSQVKRSSPQIVETVLSQDKSSATIGFDLSGQSEKDMRQQLVRYILGPRDVHRLAYYHQGGPLSKETSENWTRILQGAKLLAVDAPTGDSDTEAKKAVLAIAEAVAKDLSAAKRWKPSIEQLAAVTASPAAKQKLFDYCEKMYSEIPSGSPASKPGQTEVRVFGPSLDSLPGGYKIYQANFHPAAKFYGFKFIKPGESLGMSYDGVFEVAGKWYFLPKPWRAFAN